MPAITIGSGSTTPPRLSECRSRHQELLADRAFRDATQAWIAGDPQREAAFENLAAHLLQARMAEPRALGDWLEELGGREPLSDVARCAFETDYLDLPPPPIPGSGHIVTPLVPNGPNSTLRAMEGSASR